MRKVFQLCAFLYASVAAEMTQSKEYSRKMEFSTKNLTNQIMPSAKLLHTRNDHTFSGYVLSFDTERHPFYSPFVPEREA